MNARGGVVWAVLSAVGLCGGCAASKQKHFAEVQQAVQERTGQQIRWFQGRPEDLAVAERIHEVLDEPLSLQAAVQVALLNNPVLQSQFEEVGVAQADLVQAGLLRNPSLWGRTRWPDFSPTKPDVEFALTQDILDIFLLPLRRKIVDMELQQVKLRLGQTVLATIVEVRTAYYALQAAQQVRQLRQDLLDIIRRGSEQADQGQGFAPLNQVDLTSLQVTYRRAQIDLARSQADVQVARAALQRLMGVAESPMWTVTAELPLPPPIPSVTLADLEATALEKRLDLKATNFDLTTPAIQMARLGLFGSVFLIVDAEHTSGGGNLVGPALQSDIPLWNWRQGQISSLKHQGRQGSYNVLAARLQVLYDVRVAYARVISARSAVDMYRMQVLPLQARLTEMARQQHGPSPNLTDWLQVQQNENDVRSEFVTLLRDYWAARAELERAIGTQIPVPESAEASATQITLEAAATQLATQPAGPIED